MNWLKEVERKLLKLEKELEKQETAIVSQREIIQSVRTLIATNIGSNASSDTMARASNASNGQTNCSGSNVSHVVDSVSSAGTSLDVSIVGTKRPNSALSQLTLSSSKKQATASPTILKAAPEVIVNKKQRALDATIQFSKTNYENNSPRRYSFATIATPKLKLPSKPNGMSQATFNTMLATGDMISKQDNAMVAILQNERQKAQQSVESTTNSSNHVETTIPEPIVPFAAVRNNPQIYGDVATTTCTLQNRPLIAPIKPIKAVQNTSVLEPTQSTVSISRGKATIQSNKESLKLSHSDSSVNVLQSVQPITAAPNTTPNTAQNTADNSSTGLMTSSLNDTNSSNNNNMNNNNTEELLMQLGGLKSTAARSEAVKTVLNNSFFDKTPLRKLLQQGGRELFFEWLSVAEVEVERVHKIYITDKYNASNSSGNIDNSGVTNNKNNSQYKRMLGYLENLIKVLDQAVWTTETINEHRFDKILRRLYKTLYDENDTSTSSVSVTTLLKEVWSKYRSLYKGIIIPDSSNQSVKSETSSIGVVTNHTKGVSTSQNNISIQKSGAAAAAISTKTVTPAKQPSTVTSTSTSVSSSKAIPPCVSTTITSTTASSNNSNTVSITATTAAALLNEVSKKSSMTAPGAITADASNNNKSSVKASTGVTAQSTVPVVANNKTNEHTNSTIVATQPTAIASTQQQQTATNLSQNTVVIHSTAAIDAATGQPAHTLAERLQHVVLSVTMHSVSKLLMLRFSVMPNDAVTFLTTGGQKLLLSWLDPLAAVPSTTLPTAGGGLSDLMIVEIIENIVTILDMLPWSGEDLAVNRFDKTLKKLYKKYKDTRLSTTLTALLTNCWTKHKETYVLYCNDTATSADGTVEGTERVEV